MSIEVDARGLTCPEPLIATKKALDGMNSGIVTTLVDNYASKENVVKFALSQQCGVVVDERNGQYIIRITKPACPVCDVPQTAVVAESATTRSNQMVYLITQDSLGHGDQQLGHILIKSLFVTLLEVPPRTIMLINSGVKLATAASPVREHLETLAAGGVEILSCGTCLDYYTLKDQLAVGKVSNMYTIVEKLTQAGQAITL